MLYIICHFVRFGVDMYIVPITDKKLTPINPLQFGYQDCPPSHGFGPAVRTYWLLHFVVSGCGKFCINGKEYRLGAGEMFTIPPYVETYYEADEHDPWSYIWVGFECDTLPVNLADRTVCPSALKVFGDMKKCRDFEGGRNLYLVSKIIELFSILDDRRNHEVGYVERAKSYIEGQYMLGIGVEDVARHLGINRSYFSDIFKKETGLSPAKYLMRHRMSVAASLLQDSKMSVATTAHSVGYPDAFTFSKAFKKYFGASPIVYTGTKKS